MRQRVSALIKANRVERLRWELKKCGSDCSQWGKSVGGGESKSSASLSDNLVLKAQAGSLYRSVSKVTPTCATTADFALRPLKCWLVGQSKGARFPPASRELCQSLLGGSGRHADGERPAGRVGHLPLLGQEGARRGREGGAAATAEARLHCQLLKVHALTTKSGWG